jgi:hypothetical protein
MHLFPDTLSLRKMSCDQNLEEFPVMSQFRLGWEGTRAAAKLAFGPAKNAQWSPDMRCLHDLQACYYPNIQ